MTYLTIQGLGDVQSLRNQLALAKTQLSLLQSQPVKYKVRGASSITSSGAVRRRGGGILSRLSLTEKTGSHKAIYDLAKAGNATLIVSSVPSVNQVVSTIDTALDNIKALEEQINAEGASVRPTLTVPTPSVPLVQPGEVPSIPPDQQLQPTQPPQPPQPIQTGPSYINLPSTAPTPPSGKPINKGLLFGGAAAVAVVAGMFLLGD